MIRKPIRYPISAVEQGKVYNGHYTFQDGLVMMESAFGSLAEAGGKSPKATAQRLLLKAVQDWQL